jgi:outer membrane protein TolC
MSYNKTPRSSWLAVCISCVLFTAPLAAQEPPISQPKEEGNRFTRFFGMNYMTPAVRTLQVRGESLIDFMMQDGRLLLSEQDAVNLALANNVDLNVQRYVPYFQLWGMEGARSVLNPVVQFGPGLNRNVTPATSALQGGAAVLNLTSTYSVSVHKPFESGLDFDFNFSSVRARTNSFFSSLNPSINSLWSIGLTQHLLQGFGNIGRGHFLWVARNNYNVSVENFSVNVINAVTNVLNTYWNLVFNDEDITVKEASLKLAQLTLEQTRIQEQVGTMAPLDVLQAQAQVAAVNQELIVSRYNRRITEDQLRRLLSSRPNQTLMAATIVPTSKVLPPAPPSGNLNDAVQRALEIRPEIKAQELNQANNKIQVDYARNQLRPVLDFNVGYSQNGLGGNTIVRDFSNGFFNAPIISVTPGGFGQSLTSLFSGGNLGYVVGFLLRVPIGNDQARANSAQAQITYKQGEETLRALRQQITYQVRQAYDTVALNQASVQAAQVTVDYQEKRLQGEQDKFALGASTTFLVLQAQRDLENARNVLLQSRISWIQSRIALDQVVGDTLSAHSIALEDTLNLPKK